MKFAIGDISGWRTYIFLGVAALCLVSGLAQAQLAPDSSAQACPNNTFECLHPEFLKTLLTPSYWRDLSSTSPATYNPVNNDFISQFTSPSGKQVTVVVKSPVITQEYDVPQITANQTVCDYLNNALYDSTGKPRTQTYIKFPNPKQTNNNGIYNFDFPLNSNCSQNGVHWQIPSGAADLVIDGQGSTVNFSDFYYGLQLPNVNRVIIKNFTFQWPNIQLASVGTVTATGGNGVTGYTYDVHIDPITGLQPKMLAAATLWDNVAGHWSLINDGQYDNSYGDGMTNGVPWKCVETPGESGCTAKGIPANDAGSEFKTGQSVLLRYYDYAGAIVASGQDITFDTITLKNVIGWGFTIQQGRGFRVTHCTLTRMANQPISAEGNASGTTGAVSGDVVFDNNTLGYQGDDGFQINLPFVQYLPPTAPSNNTPMPAFAFNKSVPDQLQWPAGYLVQKDDVFALYDNALNFQGVIKVKSVTVKNSGTSILTLDQDMAPSLADDGFIVGDLTNSAGARYVINNNTFQYNRARALILQTPFGWVHNNHFVGQTMREMYLLTSQYWGEGGGAQELVINNNLFDDTWHQGDFLALNVMAESIDLNEVTNLKSAAPSVNQNIVVADNTFISDRITAVVNLSSVNNVVFSGNSFQLTPNLQSNTGDQYPISVHDASNIYFDDKNTYSPAWLSQGSCTNSRLLNLTNPPAKVSAYLPAACGIETTTSNLTMDQNI